MKVLRTLIALLGLLAFLALAVLGFRLAYLGSNQSDFQGPTSAEDPLPPQLLADLDRYVLKSMDHFDVPGAAMVLVHGEQVVLSRGYGVRDLETKEPVTSATLFGIGSSTKPMTAVMIASLVDDEVIAWDTPVTEVMPSFALSDPERSSQITFADTLCMCEGVPRRMEAISTGYSEMTAETIIESLASIPLSRSPGLGFDYSSRMLAAGGYAAAMAAGGGYGDLGPAYAQLVQERLLDPLGMIASTFSIDEALASGAAATPYYSSLSGYQAILPEIEGIFTPIAPAGALWSTADDLAQFLIMALNGGIAPSGQRVVSAENLAVLWEPQVAIDESISYGLGWHIEDYHGLTVLHHPGGTVGFAAELVLIPERQVGLALLTNRLDMVRPLGRMTTYRLLEMMTGREQVYDQAVREDDRMIRWQLFTLSLVTRRKADPDDVDPFLGSYHNDTLGEVEFVLHQDNSLWVDFGEYESRLRRMLLEENTYLFEESVFVGKTLTLEQGLNGRVTMSWPGDEASYRFVKEN